jgi:hypothetical protein
MLAVSGRPVGTPLSLRGDEQVVLVATRAGSPPTASRRRCVVAQVDDAAGQSELFVKTPADATGV